MVLVLILAMLSACVAPSTQSPAAPAATAASSAAAQPTAAPVATTASSATQGSGLPTLPVAKTVPGLKANKPYKIAVLFPNAGDPYFQQKQFGYEDEAKKVGVTLKFYDAGGYANIDKQISQIEDAAQQQFDAIAIAVTSSTATVPALEAAQQKGILVVGDGVFPQSDKIIKRGEDSALAGYNAGKYFCDTLKDGGKVGLLLGPPGIDLIKLREDGVKAALAQCPKVQVAKELHNLSDMVHSTQAAEDIIQSTPDLKGMYTFNSVVAQAAASSLQAAGKKPGDVIVTTVDLDPDLEKAMKDGWVQETSVAGSVLLGRVVVDTIVQKLNGEDVSMEAYLVPNQITVSNLNSFDRSILYPEANKQ
jgi:ABC-type sugar transport system substrate-binding protein